MFRLARRLLSAVAVAALLLASSPAVWAGAWTLPKNHWYVEYFIRYFGSKKEFNAEGSSGRRANTAIFRDIRNELKLEYGLTDWWNVLASVPYLSSHYRDDNIDLLRTGIGDMYVRTKFRVLNHPVLDARQPLVGSVQFSYKLPGYDTDKEFLGDGQVDLDSRLQLSQAWTFSTGADDITARASRDEAIRESVMLASMVERALDAYDAGQYADAVPWFQAVLEAQPDHYEALRVVLNHAAQTIETAAADGDWTVMPVADAYWEPALEPAAGVSAAPAPSGVAFVNLEGGFTGRNGAPANEVPLVAEVGFTPLKRLMLIGSVDSVVGIRSTNEQIENFAKVGLRGIWNLKGDGFASIFKTGGPTINLEFGYDDVVAGRNTADAFEVFGKLSVIY